MQQINFIKGERRKLTMLVTANSSAAFSITDAKYKLIYSDGTSEVEDRNCTIDNIEHTFFAIIAPEKVGRYTLVFTYIIADEVMVVKLPLHVEGV